MPPYPRIQRLSRGEYVNDAVDVWYVGSRRDGGQNRTKYRMLKDDGDYPAFLAAMQRAVREDDADAWNRAVDTYTISMRPYVAEALVFLVSHHAFAF